MFGGGRGFGRSGENRPLGNRSMHALTPCIRLATRGPVNMSAGTGTVNLFRVIPTAIYIRAPTWLIQPAIVYGFLNESLDRRSNNEVPPFHRPTK